MNESPYPLENPPQDEPDVGEEVTPDPEDLPSLGDAFFHIDDVLDDEGDPRA